MKYRREYALIILIISGVLSCKPHNKLEDNLNQWQKEMDSLDKESAPALEALKKIDELKILDVKPIDVNQAKKNLLEDKLFKDNERKFEFSFPNIWSETPISDINKLNQFYHNAGVQTIIGGIYLTSTGNAFAPPNFLIKFSNSTNNLKDFKTNAQKIFEGGRKSGIVNNISYGAFNDNLILKNNNCFVDSNRKCIITFSEIKVEDDSLISIGLVFIAEHGTFISTFTCNKIEYGLHKKTLYNIIQSFRFL